MAQVEGGFRYQRTPIPAAVISPRMGTARRAAAGESTTSNSGTGSRRRSCSPPSEQLPRLGAGELPPAATAQLPARIDLVERHHERLGEGWSWSAHQAVDRLGPVLQPLERAPAPERGPCYPNAS
jgi:hypothetical protein